MEILGYLTGLVAHTIVKWFFWWAKYEHVKLSDYWRTYGKLNIAALISAIPMLFLWTSGAFPEILRLVGQGFVNIAATVTMTATDYVAQTPSGFVASMGAGYFADSIARTVWLHLDKPPSDK